MEKPVQTQKFVAKPPGPGPRKDRPRFNRGAKRIGKGPFNSYRNNKKPAPANSQSSIPVNMPEGLIFYCKSCEQIVDYKPATFDFKYPIENCLKAKAEVSEEKRADLMCDIAYGTERSIKHFYKIKDDKFDKERREREERAAKADKF